LFTTDYLGDTERDLFLSAPWYPHVRASDKLPESWACDGEMQVKWISSKHSEEDHVQWWIISPSG